MFNSLVQLKNKAILRILKAIFGKRALTRQEIQDARQRGEMSEAMALYITAPPGSLPGDDDYDPGKAIPLSRELELEIHWIRESMKGKELHGAGK